MYMLDNKSLILLLLLVLLLLLQLYLANNVIKSQKI